MKYRYQEGSEALQGFAQTLKNVTPMALCAIVCLVVFSLAQAAPAVCAENVAPRKLLRLLSGPVGGPWHTLGELLSPALSPVLPVINRAGAGVSNIKAVDEKKADIAFTLACFLGAGQSGVDEYQHLKADNVTLLASLYPQVLYFLIRKDFAEKHGISGVGDLLRPNIPLRFASLKPGTASEFVISMLLQYGYNTSFDQLKQQGWSIDFNNYAEMTDGFTEGRLDCFAYTAGATAPLIHSLEDVAEVLILPVDQAALDTLRDRFNTGIHIIEPGAYKCITKPVVTLGDRTVLIIQRALPDDLVYQIASHLWNSRGMISESIKDFAAFSPEKAQLSGFMTHPGAARFWNELLSSKSN